MEKIVPITIAYGDGIGPEIMESTLRILKEARAGLSFESIEIGKRIFEKYGNTGISEDNLNLIKYNKILLKAPTTTPQGKGFRSVNVELRKSLGLYANVRPAVSYYPVINTLHPKMNVVIIRENEEDLYSGIEYKQTSNMSEAIKIISHIGSEKIIRFAFEYALKNNRKTVCCFTKDNIMKITEGMFHNIFKKIALEYEGKITAKHYIIDIGTALLSTRPEEFDVIVTSNLFGDIISDITAELSASVGMSGSANIGLNYSMFEAIHGSAPDISGQNKANPSGLINAAIMMLRHIGGRDYIAAMIENALKKTLEEGIHTQDVYDVKNSKQKVSTDEFTYAIIKRLGQKPNILPQAVISKDLKDIADTKIHFSIPQEEKTLVGVDVYIENTAFALTKLANKIETIIAKSNNSEICLNAIYSKGLKLWPGNFIDGLNDFSDCLCFRFLFAQKSTPNLSKIIKMVDSINNSGIRFIKIVNLYNFNGIQGYF
ncbi:MAG: NADP-dependent isocitrate dehydrogenase [Rickettsia sp.]|nr:NADP-dependent isocitrate dehydrogenase [Rickettsia sp.]